MFDWHAGIHFCFHTQLCVLSCLLFKYLVSTDLIYTPSPEWGNSLTVLGDAQIHTKIHLFIHMIALRKVELQLEDNGGFHTFPECVDGWCP